MRNLRSFFKQGSPKCNLMNIFFGSGAMRGRKGEREGEMGIEGEREKVRKLETESKIWR